MWTCKDGDGGGQALYFKQNKYRKVGKHTDFQKKQYRFSLHCFSIHKITLANNALLSPSHLENFPTLSLFFCFLKVQWSGWQIMEWILYTLTLVTQNFCALVCHITVCHRNPIWCFWCCFFKVLSPGQAPWRMKQFIRQHKLDWDSLCVLVSSSC